MSKDSDLVWYASYGSNVFRKRFDCYIKGGRIAGNNRVYSGARDTTPPLSEQNISIPYQLYFAKTSVKWNGGGVGFIRHERDEKNYTLGKMYLITRQQFNDVVRQESNLQQNIEIDFDHLQRQGQQNVINNVWYGRMLYLGSRDSYPIFSFTHSANLTEYNPPSAAYLSVIMKGLKTNFRLSESEMIAYLKRNPGINEGFDEAQLRHLYHQQL